MTKAVALSIPDGDQNAKITLVLYAPSPKGLAIESIYPLIIISHGSGGNAQTHRQLATGLAERGYRVAVPNHPGNTTGDDGLAFTEQNLVNRPRHLKLVIDQLAAEGHCEGGVVLIGHSIGAASVLALGGGRMTTLSRESEGRRPKLLPDFSGPRVRALVLLAPALFWYKAKGALAGLSAPVLMMQAERDEILPLGQGNILRRGLRQGLDFRERLVPGAGHFSFLSPFPPKRVSADFPPSQDPPGFDRAAFQADLVDEVAAFIAAVI
ncbi:MAG: alpha/beta hydrolase family protein [Rhodospirillales bacterium]